MCTMWNSSFQVFSCPYSDTSAPLHLHTDGRGQTQGELTLRFSLPVVAFAFSSPNLPLSHKFCWYVVVFLLSVSVRVDTCNVSVSESSSLHTAFLPLHALSLCRPLSVSLSSSVQAFPALAQVQSLRRVNECLLAENRAMLRVLARLSETASMPETEDLWSSDIISLTPHPFPHFSAT